MSTVHTVRTWRAPPGGPAGRFRRRLTVAGTVAAALTALLAFPGAVGRQAAAFCTAFAQPGLGDACAGLGVKGVPTRSERELWQSAGSGSCEALRRYLREYPDGAFGAPAARRLAAARWQRSSRWKPFDRTTVGAMSLQQDPLPTEALARRDVLSRIPADAAPRGCRPVDGSERLVRVEVDFAEPSCTRALGGYLCSADYRATCKMAARELEETC
ncbi:MAG TPA: hypothetical protein VF547_11420 [Allosphingosinicella sp.]|jgi:hypothetical protein